MPGDEREDRWDRPADARAVSAEMLGALRTLVDERYDGLKEALDRAGVPWTPGRGVQGVGGG